MQNEKVHLGSNERPYILEIEIKPKTFQQKLLKLFGLHKNVERLPIRGLTLKPFTEICNILSSINIDLGSFNPERISEEGPSIVSQHHDTLCKVIAIAVRNYRGEYSKRIKKLLSEELTAQDLLKAMIVVKSKMHIEDFLATIYMWKGVNILEKDKN